MEKLYRIAYFEETDSKYSQKWKYSLPLRMVMKYFWEEDKDAKIPLKSNTGYVFPVMFCFQG